VALDRVGIHSIHELETLEQAGGSPPFGGRRSGSDVLPLANALWVASTTFGTLAGGSKDNYKRIWVISNDDDPCKGNESEIARLAQRVKDCRQTHEEISLWAIERRAPFRASLSWLRVVTPVESIDMDPEAEEGLELTQPTVNDEHPLPASIESDWTLSQSQARSDSTRTHDTEAAASITASVHLSEEDMEQGVVLRQGGVVVYHPDMGLANAFLDSRRRAHHKRTLARLPLRLPGGVDIGVNLFLSTLTSKTPLGRKVEARTNRLLKASTSWICEDTGKTLRRHDIAHSLPVGGGGETVPIDLVDAKLLRAMPASLTPEEQRLLVSFPLEKLSAASEAPPAAPTAEVEMKKMDDDPCLLVLSAHPVSHLRPWMITRGSFFLFPSESAIRGSTSAFSAVVSELAKSHRMLLARCVMRAGNSPRLVALLPQISRPGASLSSTGLVALDLPFEDDFRTPKLPFGSPTAPDEAVEAAKDVVMAVNLKQFDPDHFPSPTLGKFFATARAMALGEQTMTWDATEDDVARPDPSMGELPRFVEPLTRLAEAIDANAPEAEPPRPSKRPAGGGAPSAKRSKNDGSLESMTVPQLKERARELGLPVSNRKKAELIALIRSKE
jgi:hypothetical protein